MKAIAILLLGCLAAGNSAAGAPLPASVTDFRWLSGCWASTGAQDRYEEVWLAPTANSMLGVSRSIRGSQTRMFEYARIVLAADRIDYVAQPQGAPPTAFRLADAVGTRAVFENPAHDFPQRIIYEFVPPDRLNARIEGKDAQGRTTGEDFHLRRTSCGELK